MDNLGAILPFVLIALVFWFLIVRPQRKRQQDMASTQASMTPGAEVMLGSGIYGRVTSLDEETLQLEVSPGTTVKVARRAVVRVLDESSANDPGSTDGDSTTTSDEQD
ncbi:MAG TPA: preprotein translocase subunit YajC [Nocardioidaceae bacterium]|nr:preprotein translocase subunit YajC [Nocardioidaceae bacterium]